jgi:hypothetical protein
VWRGQRSVQGSKVMCKVKSHYMGQRSCTGVNGCVQGSMVVYRVKGSLQVNGHCRGQRSYTGSKAMYVVDGHRHGQRLVHVQWGHVNGQVSYTALKVGMGVKCQCI